MLGIRLNKMHMYMHRLMAVIPFHSYSPTYVYIAYSSVTTSNFRVKAILVRRSSISDSGNNFRL